MSSSILPTPKRTKPTLQPSLFEMGTPKKTADLVGKLQVARPFCEPALLLGTSSFTATGWQGTFYPAGMLRRNGAVTKEKNNAALMMCDIDHFKRVNDEFGHAVGEMVLQKVSRRLQHSVRSYNMVGRYGGEEFLVMLNRCDPVSAVSRAESLRATLCANLYRRQRNRSW
jgi:predicted signal transduction protein with EAL and GGDEF domain